MTACIPITAVGPGVLGRERKLKQDRARWWRVNDEVLVVDQRGQYVDQKGAGVSPAPSSPGQDILKVVESGSPADDAETRSDRIQDGTKGRAAGQRLDEMLPVIGSDRSPGIDPAAAQVVAGNALRIQVDQQRRPPSGRAEASDVEATLDNQNPTAGLSVPIMVSCLACRLSTATPRL